MKLLFGVTFLLSVFSTGVSGNSLANENARESQNSLRIGSRRVEDEATCLSVKDTICSMGTSRQFCELVTKAAKTYSEFGEFLDGGKSFTVFVPSDNAFKDIEELLLKLSPEEMYRTLLFHFYKDVVLTFDELDCQGKLTSLTGDTSRTKCSRIEAGVYKKYQRGKGNKEFNNNPTIQPRSKEACTGMIHRVNSVMLPVLFTPFAAESGDKDDTPIFDEDDDFEVVEVAVPTKFPTQPPTEKAKVVDPVEDINGEVDTIAEQTQDNTLCFVQPCVPKATIKPTLNPDLFDGGGKDKIGVDGSVPGTNLDETEITAPEPEAPGETTIVVEQEEESKRGIGALGINLIIFSTLLLCFMFVCMRK